MNFKIILVTIGLVLVLGGIIWIVQRGQTPGQLDTFATCLSEKKATFYGAWWCPHCKSQKELFGLSQRLLPYVECSSTDGNSVTPICKSKDIKGYPTWEFADGSRMEGEMSLAQLSEKTGCVLPTSNN